MAFLVTKIFKDLGGLPGAIKREAGKVNLRPCKTITIAFDPFTKEAKEVREFHHAITEELVVLTGPSTNIKVNIQSNRSEATVHCLLSTGEDFLFKCRHLKTLEILELYNEHISILGERKTTGLNPAVATNIKGKLTKGKK